MNLYIIAGEASGDLHGSNLIRELHRQQAGLQIRCWGGDLMEQAGATLVKHYRELAFMGFVEVLKNLRTILRNLRACKEDILQFRPHAIILIDYPGFNLRIARWAKEQGIPVIYYISPQVWAWKENRVKAIRRDVEQMLVILPFEKDFYKQWNYEVEYVGHPLAEVIESYKLQAASGGQQMATATLQPPTSSQPDLSSNPRPQAANIIALLPGSRRQEIAIKLPIMLQASRAFPDYQFVVAKAPGLGDDFYAPLLSGYANVSAVSGKTYDLLLQARAALVTSGTATLETALFGVPEVVCYKGNAISYQIARRLIKVKYISLVNLIMDKMVVKELIQHELTPANLERELKDLLHNKERQQQLQADYTALQALLSQGGHASANAAASMLRFLNGRGK
jgi:lipid-A-disaccharide synthase